MKWIFAALLLVFSSSAISVQRCDTCERDNHDRIKRSASAKKEFKRERPCPSTGKRRGSCPGYEIDHAIPLSCGGLDSPGNMQWLTKQKHKEKSRNERARGCAY